MEVVMTKNVEKLRNDVPVNVKPTRPFQDIEHRMHDLESRFEDFFSADWMRPSTWEFPEWASLNQADLKVPKMDIVDRDVDILVRMDLPGVKKEDIDVSLTDNTVTVKGSTGEEKKEEDGDYYLRETMKGTFSRTMVLPSEVDGSKAESSFKDGVLEITVPKHEKARRHTIRIS
jgi:HSP20 family protein